MLLGILLSALALELCLLLKKRFEELLPVLISAAVLVCAGLAMFRALQGFIWIVSAAALLGFVAVIRQTLREGKGFSRRWFAYAFTPGLLCFILLAVLMAVSALQHRVYHTDDLYEWALQPLSLYYRNGFVGPALHLSPDFMTYTPGVHLLQWIGLTLNGSWNEGVVYLWLWLAYASFLLPFTRTITWKKAWQIPLYILGILLIPAVFSTDAYSVLRVDVLLGVCLGYALLLVWRIVYEESNRLFLCVSLALTLSFLVLIKQTGIGWLLVPASLLIVLGKQERRHHWKETALILLPPLAVFVGWLLFCQLTGLRGAHTTALANNAEKLFGGNLVTAQDTVALFAAVCASLLRGSIPPVVLAVVGIGFPFLLAGCGRLPKATAKRLAGLIALCLAGFVLAFYIAMLTAFRSSWTSPVDAAAIAPLMDTIQRYGCAAWYALLMLFLHLSLTPGIQPLLSAPLRKTRWLCRPLAGVCCLLVLCGVDWGALTMNLMPGRYVENPVTAELDGLADSSQWSSDIENPQDAIVMLASDSYPYNRKWLQYVLAPLKVIMPFDITWSEAKFTERLKEDQIMYFISEGTENELSQLAAGYTEDGVLEDYTLYAVQWENGTPVLTDASEL